jgi:Ca2+-binding RTX toxin-like protein
MLEVTFGYTGSSTQVLTFSETLSAAEQTKAIQKALDAVAGHAGGYVNLSAGTFTVTGTGKASDGALRIGSNTDLSGAGSGLSILKLADDSTSVTGIVRTDSGGTNPDGSVKTTHDVIIENLSIDGNQAATSGAVDGFYCGPKPNSAAYDSNITLNHVEVMNVSRYGFDPHEQTKGLTFTNCVAHNNGVDGFTIDFATDVSLVNNAAYDNGRHGFNVVTSSSDVRFLDNDAWGNGQSGIVVQTGDNELRAPTHGISISGGHIYDNGRAGIEVRQAADVSIHDTWLSGNVREAIILSGVDGANLASNAMSGNGGTVRIEGFLQTFGDTDTGNDRWVATHNVYIDGAHYADPLIPTNVTLYNYSITTGDDLINGSKGKDTIAAGSGHDTVYGQGGNDTLYGEDGNDKLYGGTGSDILNGNDGDDRLMGDAGWDTLTGGRGKDTFAFASGWGTDTITDFKHGTDKLDLKAVANLDSFAQLSLVQSGFDTKVGFGSDYIVLKNVDVATLTTTDFLL